MGVAIVDGEGEVWLGEMHGVGRGTLSRPEKRSWKNYEIFTQNGVLMNSEWYFCSCLRHKNVEYFA